MRTLWYRLLVCLLLIGLQSGAHASFVSLKPIPNVVSNADQHGYVRIVRPLGDLELGPDWKQPLSLVFSSDPSKAPTVLGYGWSLPLFDSRVVQYDNDHLAWDGPNEYRQFFVKGKEDSSRRGETPFDSTNGLWKAVVRTNGDVRITGRDANWFFEYRNGLLREFRMGAQSDVHKIDYQARGELLRVISVRTGRVIFSIDYLAGMPRLIRIGDRQIGVEMGDGDLFSADGKMIPTSSLQSRYLRKLTMEGNEIALRYEKAGTLERKVLSGAGSQEMKEVPVNRLTFTEQGRESFVEWEAVSGFAAADSGGKYEVVNDSYDPYLNPGVNSKSGKGRMAPVYVSVKRKGEDGNEQLWSYNWRAGVRVWSDPASGSSSRLTFIMAPGPAYLALRKREVLREGAWVPVQQNSYDTQGRLVRSIEEAGVFVWRYYESKGVSYVDVLHNDTLKRSQRLGKNNQVVERIIYHKDGKTTREWLNEQKQKTKEILRNGQTKEYQYDDKGRLKTVLLDGVLHSSREYREDGKLHMETVYDAEGKLPHRRYISLYDENGKYLQRTIDNSMFLKQ
jgi:YD repeat-containing protein